MEKIKSLEDVVGAFGIKLKKKAKDPKKMTWKERQTWLNKEAIRRKGGKV